jgi:hypothetical protein
VRPGGFTFRDRRRPGCAGWLLVLLREEIFAFHRLSIGRATAHPPWGVHPTSDYRDPGEGDANDKGSPTQISTHPAQAVGRSSTNRRCLSARLTNRVLFSGRHKVTKGLPRDNRRRKISHSTPNEKTYSRERPASDPSSTANGSTSSNAALSLFFISITGVNAIDHRAATRPGRRNRSWQRPGERASGQTGSSPLGADLKLQSRLPAGRARSLFLCDSHR